MRLDAALQKGMVVIVAAVVVVGVCTFSLEKMLATYAVGIVGIAGILLPDWEFFHQDFPQWFAFMRARRATAGRCPASWRFRLYRLSSALITLIYAVGLFRWWMFVSS
ncbi:signal peptidase complex-like protein DTM1 isoform X1 [Musa acuminata AAA Group]|uniref:signal peptidase complex-like protein DTM1 isoform X1 n=1 Tax=Musa acuminata AAA Group TaxID=214697 RepID=UPI0031E177D4